MPRPQPPPSPRPRPRPRPVRPPPGVKTPEPTPGSSPVLLGNDAPATSENPATTTISDGSADAQNQQPPVSTQPVSGDTSPQVHMQHSVGTFEESGSSSQSRNTLSPQVIPEFRLDGTHGRAEAISESKDGQEMLDQTVNEEHHGHADRDSPHSIVALENQDAALAPDTTAMTPIEQAESQGHDRFSEANMTDIVCYLLPLSALASKETTELFLRGSTHVETVPYNLKQSLTTTGGSEHCIVLRRSNLGKTSTNRFLFGGDASTCDIPFTSKELSGIQFRIYEDEHGVVTAQDDIPGNPVHDMPAMGVYVSHPDDLEGRLSPTRALALPLKNASTICIGTEARSADWMFSVFLPVHDTSEYSDIESLASVSDVPTMTSGTTLSSLGSQLDISEAMDEVAQLLLKDEVLGPLFRTSLQKTATDKAERNYTRLIIGFARDLRREAKNPIEHHVGKLVKFKARFISQTLVSAIDPSRRERTAQFESFLQQDEQREGRLEQFLESLAITGDIVDATKNVPPPIDSDGQMSDESAGEDDLPRLSQIKDFIQLSTALAELRKKLKSFASPDEAMLQAKKEADTRDMSVEPVRERLSNLEGFLDVILRLALRVDQRTVDSLTERFLRFIRPRVPQGHRRITWVCGCGKPMYSDVRELYDGGAAELEQDLRSSADGAARSATISSSNNLSQEATQRQGSSSSNFSAISGSTLAHPPGPRLTSSTSGTPNGDASIAEG